MRKTLALIAVLALSVSGAAVGTASGKTKKKSPKFEVVLLNTTKQATGNKCLNKKVGKKPNQVTVQSKGYKIEIEEAAEGGGWEIQKKYSSQTKATKAAAKAPKCGKSAATVEGPDSDK